VLADPGIPERYTRIVAVEYSPQRDRALVFIEYNEPPHVEPYHVLCERDGEGWVAGNGSNFSDWMLTHHDEHRGDVGVRTLGWDPPTVQWDVPSADV
jgi:hypothetical protein